MSGWSKTTKPSADNTIDAANIFGVDVNEVTVVPGIANPGWAVKRVISPTRTVWETLVAMKDPPTEDNADDTDLPDTVITITSQPQNVTVASNAATSFSVTATASPTATLTYAWQTSANGVTYTSVTNGGVYSNATTSTLNISNVITLDGQYYRAVVSGTNTGVSATSNAANITHL